ncbi:MAG: hypothetical protein R8L53_01280 [Mariprofundales bacterium]
MAQLAPVLLALQHKVPQIKFIIRSSLAEETIRQRLPIVHECLFGITDIGVVQNSAIDENWPATQNKIRQYYQGFDQYVNDEVTRLAVYNPKLIISDISPLAFPVAKKLGIAGVGVANLDWHDIYVPQFAKSDPEIMATIAKAHTQACILLRMPLHMPMQTFNNIKNMPVPLMSSEHLPKQLHQYLRLTNDKYKKTYDINKQKIALVMFGGAAMPTMQIQNLAAISNWLFVFFSCPSKENIINELPDNVLVIDYAKPFSSYDLMMIADVVICKPGYGILTEAWNADMPVIYTARPKFAEYQYLHHFLQQYTSSILLSTQDLLTCNWQSALEKINNNGNNWPAINSVCPDCADDVDGANYIADILTSFISEPVISVSTHGDPYSRE